MSSNPRLRYKRWMLTFIRGYRPRFFFHLNTEMVRYWDFGPVRLTHFKFKLH